MTAPERRDLTEHRLRAYDIFNDAHRMPDWVARSDIAECARLLARDPGRLACLAVRSDERRVGLERTDRRGGDPNLEVLHARRGGGRMQAAGVAKGKSDGM